MWGLDRGDTSLVSDAGERPQSWWTGKRPDGAPGFLAGQLQSLKLPNLSTCTRAEALDYFDNTWTLTEVLFSALQGRPSLSNPNHPFWKDVCMGISNTRMLSR